MIPVVYSADWSTYSTLHFTGGRPTPTAIPPSSVNDTWAQAKGMDHLKPVM